MMKGKIKPKPKEDEPEMPTLRKRSVAKDKVVIKYEYNKKVLNKKSFIINENYIKYLCYLGRREKTG